MSNKYLTDDEISNRILSKSFNRWFVKDDKYITEKINNDSDIDILDIKIDVLKNAKRFETRREVIIDTLSYLMLDAYTSFFSWLLCVVLASDEENLKSYSDEELKDILRSFFKEIIFDKKYKNDNNHKILYLYMFQDDIYDNILKQLRYIDKKPNRAFLKRSKLINFYHKRNLPNKDQQELYKNKLKHIIELVLLTQSDAHQSWIDFFTDEFEQLYKMELESNGYK